MRSHAHRLAFLLAALCLCGTEGFPASGAAPADAAFGPFKMTPLQIRLKISNLGRAYHARWTSDHDILHDASLAEGALRIWRNAYPDDPWLAETAFHLEQLYQQVQTAEARKLAASMLDYVVAYWPNTTYGRTSRLRRAHGFPRLHPEPAVRPTPNPYARRPSPPPTPRPTPRSSSSPTPVHSPALPTPTRSSASPQSAPPT